MTLRHNLDEFRRDIQAIAQQLEEDWIDGAVEIGVAGYAALLEKTEDTGSVDTGAYRAEHLIEQDGEPIVENPDRVGADAPLPPRKRFGLPPLIGPLSLDSVRQQLEQRIRPGQFSFVNRRFVALYLEFGTVFIEPRAIFQTSRDVTEKAADRIAEAISIRRRSE